MMTPAAVGEMAIMTIRQKLGRSTEVAAMSLSSRSSTLWALCCGGKGEWGVRGRGKRVRAGGDERGREQ